jgi:hypothetical protein
MPKLEIFRWVGAVVTCAAAVLTSGCVFVPAPVPIAGPPVVVGHDPSSSCRDRPCEATTVAMGIEDMATGDE